MWTPWEACVCVFLFFFMFFWILWILSILVLNVFVYLKTVLQPLLWNLKQPWKKKLEVELSEITWDKCLASNQACSVNSRHHLIRFNVVHHLHSTKTKLHKSFPSVSPNFMQLGVRWRRIQLLILSGFALFLSRFHSLQQASSTGCTCFRWFSTAHLLPYIN